MIMKKFGYKYNYITMYTKYNYTYMCESTLKLKVLQLNKNISIN